MGTSSVSDRAQMVKRAIRLIDLTDLADDSSAEAVEALCAEAVAQHTAAVCIWPEFVATAARTLNGSGVMIATVVNFPSGEERAPAVSAAAARAVADGADEIDVVLPWRAWMEGQTQRAEEADPLGPAPQRAGSAQSQRATPRRAGPVGPTLPPYG
jgi:deoxyribose-phosphate aldolase